MDNLLDEMRESRKNPSVLKHVLISIRSVKEDELIFIFEGIEDIGVYESWITRIPDAPKYEPLAGKGKEQLLGLRRQLALGDSKLLRRVYFFVDCDFDEYDESDDHVFTLNAYSIENALCTPNSVESILCNEFRCAGSPVERTRIVEKYREIEYAFKECSSQVNFTLFLARRCGIKVLRKPEHAKEIAMIQLTNATPLHVHASDLVELERAVEEDIVAMLRHEFENLPQDRTQRGKYVISMLRQWLKELTADRKTKNPILFDQPIQNLPGEPWSMSLQRLAVPSLIPQGLNAFIDKVRISA